MKRLICVMLVFAALLPLYSCKAGQNPQNSPAEGAGAIRLSAHVTGREKGFSIIKAETDESVAAVRFSLKGGGDYTVLEGCDGIENGKAVWYFHAYHPDAEPLDVIAQADSGSGFGEESALKIAPEPMAGSVPFSADTIAGIWEEKHDDAGAYSEFVPDGMVWDEDGMYGFPYSVYCSYIRYRVESGGEIVAPRLYIAFREAKNPFVSAPGATDNMMIYVYFYSYSSDGAGRYSFSLDQSLSELSEDGSVRSYPVDGGYELLSCMRSMGRDANRGRGTIRFLCVDGTKTVYDAETPLNSEMEYAMGDFANAFIRTGGLSQAELFDAYSNYSEDSPALFCAYPTVCMSGEVTELNIYGSQDITAVTTEENGSDIIFAKTSLGRLTKWTANIPADYREGIIRIYGEVDGTKTAGFVEVAVSSPPLLETVRNNGTQYAVGQEASFFPESPSPVECWELVSADGRILCRTESGPLSAAFAEPGLNRVYVRGYLGNYYYAPKCVLTEVSVSESGEAGIIGAEIPKNIKSGEPFTVTVTASPGTSRIRLEDLTDHNTGFKLVNKYEFGSLGLDGAVLQTGEEYTDADGNRIFKLEITLERGEYYLVLVAENGSDGGFFMLDNVYVN